MTDAFPNSLKTALKEWDIVCRSLGSGRQVILLRKGGISESIGGVEIEHRRFLLFPTFLHQNPALLKPEERPKMVARAAEPDEIELAYAGDIIDIVQVQSREKMDRLYDEHIWSPPLIDMRFAYRAEKPLYVVVVRAYRLKETVRLANTAAYAGCKSWVPLEEQVDVSGAQAALEDGPFDAVLERVRQALAG